MVDNLVNIGLYAAYVLVIGSIALGLLMPLINSVGDPKSLLKGLYGILLIGAVFGISFAFSDSIVTANYAKYGIGPGLSKLVGAGLISMYLLMIIAFAGIIVTEIVKIFK